MSLLTLTVAYRLQLAIMQVKSDVRRGTVPRTVSSFSELHDYVDANYYGGFFEDGVLEALDAHLGEEGACVAFANAVQEGVDAWLKSGEAAHLCAESGASHAEA